MSCTTVPYPRKRGTTGWIQTLQCCTFSWREDALHWDRRRSNISLRSKEQELNQNACTQIRTRSPNTRFMITSLPKPLAHCPGWPCNILNNDSSGILKHTGGSQLLHSYPLQKANIGGVKTVTDSRMLWGFSFSSQKSFEQMLAEHGGNRSQVRLETLLAYCYKLTALCPIITSHPQQAQAWPQHSAPLFGIPHQHPKSLRAGHTRNNP